MTKRFFDVILSIATLLLAFPLFLVIAILIKLSSKGPALFKTARCGKKGRLFRLYKFRTMRVGAERGDAITATGDKRVFPLGQILRRSKLDELPQFWNVLRGDMSVVGPRPEDDDIVERCYTEQQRRTLDVRPGVTSPGAIFNFTHGDEYIDDDDPSGSYERRFLAVKLGLELVYVDRQSFLYDLHLIGRTIVVVAAKMMGRKRFPHPMEYEIANSKDYFSQ